MIGVRQLRAWAAWDGSNEAEVAALAGDWWGGAEGPVGFVHKPDGRVVRIQPGWVVSAWEGAEGVVCFDAGAWATVTLDAAAMREHNAALLARADASAVLDDDLES